MKIKDYLPPPLKIYLTLLKVLINYAQKHNMVRYEVDPFEFCRLPQANIRELDLTVDELKAIRDIEPSKYNIGVVRDIFMLSYYLGGINLVDMLEIDFRKDWIEYYRKKTKNKKQGKAQTAFSSTLKPVQLSTNISRKMGNWYSANTRHSDNVILLSHAKWKKLRKSQGYGNG